MQPAVADEEGLHSIQSPGRSVSFRRFFSTLLGQANLPLALGAFLLGLLGNILAGALGGWRLLGVPGEWVILTVLVLAVVGLYGYHRRRVLRPRIEMIERQPSGKAGLILILSTLDPRARGTPEEAKQRRNEAQAAINRILSSEGSELGEADFQPLWGTNLEPALRALEFHYEQGLLRECWLLGTPDETREDGQVAPGSASLGPALRRWFDHLHPGHLVRFQTDFKSKPRDYIALWNEVDRIFRSGPLRENTIICDITGGLKLMSIGAALACLSEGRTMQYMATDRDWKGEPIPKGEMRPVLVDISPYLV